MKEQVRLRRGCAGVTWKLEVVVVGWRGREGEGRGGGGREGGVIDQRVRSAVDGGVSGGEASEQVVDGDAPGTTAAAISTVVVAAAAAAINNRRVTTHAVPKPYPRGLRVGGVGGGGQPPPVLFSLSLSLSLSDWLSVDVCGGRA